MNKFLFGFVIGIIIAGGLSIFLNNSSLEFVKKNFNFFDAHTKSETIILSPDIKIQEKNKNILKEKKSEDNYDFYEILKSKIDDAKVSNDKVNATKSFYLKIDNLNSENDANAIKAQLVLIGIDSVLKKINQNEYNILIGPFKSQKDVDKIQKNLLNQNIKSNIINI